MDYRPHKRPCVFSQDVQWSRKQDGKGKHSSLPLWKVRLVSLPLYLMMMIFIPWFLFIGP